MTATVDPGEYSGMLRRNASDLRTRDYLKAITFWATHPEPRIHGVVFCENSGADLRIFEKAAAGFSSTRAFEVLGFRGNRRPPGVHYGYAELGTIDYACVNSVLLKRCRRFAKVTGRLLFPRITSLIDSLDEELLAAVDCRRAYWGEGGVPARARTELMVFEREFYEKVLMGTREQMLGKCSHIEEFVAQRLLALYRDRMPGIYLRWKVECPAFGYGAAGDKKYGSPLERLKSLLRSAGRIVVPKVWL